MAASWDHLGEIANIAQLTGLDAVRLIGMIVKAASTARMHKKNCRQFAQHLKLIGNLLEQLKISELKKYPETREPLEQLEDALRRSYILVNSCQDRSYLYLLAMGWNIVYQFRKAQGEIDRYLKIVPLITLVDNARFKERIEDIERDQREYTLDEEDRKLQDAILMPDPSKNDSVVLKKTLSCSYPNLPFDKALRKENEKLQMELQRSQAHMDVGQCQMIQHLIDVTETAANSIPEKTSPKKTHKLEPDYSYASSDNTGAVSSRACLFHHYGLGLVNASYCALDDCVCLWSSASGEACNELMAVVCVTISSRTCCVVAVHLCKNGGKWRFVEFMSLRKQKRARHHHSTWNTELQYAAQVFSLQYSRQHVWLNGHLFAKDLALPSPLIIFVVGDIDSILPW
ncbi:Cell number regulator 13 [Asimina triloba]